MDYLGRKIINISDQNKKTQNESLPGTGVFSRKTLNWTGAPWEQAEVPSVFIVLSDQGGRGDWAVYYTSL